MKKMTRISIAVMTMTIAAVLSLNVNGAGTPTPTPSSGGGGGGGAQDLPMLRSADAFKTYCVEQSSNASAQISTTLPDGNNSWDFVPIASSTALGISNTLADIALSVDVVNPNDPLYASGSTYNTDGDLLLTGYHQFNLAHGIVPVGSAPVWGLPPDYGKFQLKMVDNPPITIPGALSAIVDVLGPDGRSQQEYSVDVRNGKVYFPWRLTETNCILAVYTNNPNGGPGGWEYWNVGGTGSQIQPSHFNITLDASVEGIVPIKGNGPIFIPVPTTNGVGNNLAVELTSSWTATGNAYWAVSFWTTEGKWFTGAWIRQAGTSQWQWYPVIGSPVAYNGTEMLMFLWPIQKGVFYIVPAWNDGDLVEPSDPYVPPYYGEGKGGSEG